MISKGIYMMAALAGMAALASCYSPRYMYSPMSAHVPAIEKAGDFSATALYSAAIPGDKDLTHKSIPREKTGGADLHAAYALSKNWGVHASVYYRKEQNHGSKVFLDTDSTVIRYQRHMTELGFFYYQPLQNSNRYFLQVLAGVGMGGASFSDKGRMLNDDNFYRQHRSRVNKYFVQPNLFYAGRSGLMYTALASRFTFIHVLNYKTDYTQQEQDVLFPEPVSHKPYFFWEPALILGGSFKKLPQLKLQAQAGMGFLLSKRFLDYRSPVISAGIQFAVKSKRPLAAEKTEK